MQTMQLYYIRLGYMRLDYTDPLREIQPLQQQVIVVDPALGKGIAGYFCCTIKSGIEVHRVQIASAAGLILFC